ncbi:BrnT family toxin [Xanthobacter sp. DSM 24535]|uniref:BrnT family toxin n=1 Tax=Roseixanthobacter psychrophilus TaxID=3119917 RepID=UPI00372C256C
MEFEWDDQKAERNLEIHSISFEFAATVFFDENRIEWRDERRDYGEERIIAVGVAEGLCLCVVYTLRGDSIRMISARLAHRKERLSYGYNP